MRLPPVLKRYLVQSAIWTALCIAAEVICNLLHWGYPYNYFAVPFENHFGDFGFHTNLFAHFHSPEFFARGNVLMYPAPVLVVYKLFILFPSAGNPTFVIWRFEAFIMATSLAMALMFRRALIRRGLAPWYATLFLIPTYLLSFPLWFELHQGNMEVVMWIMVTLGIWAFWTDKPWTAAGFFGVAAAMKLFPFIFLGLFIARKQYRQAALLVMAGALTTVASLWLVCPDIPYSWRQISEGVNGFRWYYVLHIMPVESGFDHSLFCVLKRLLPKMLVSRLAQVLTVYFAVAAIAGIVLFFGKIRKQPLVNQILCLSIAAIVLPPASFDYTLLHLYAPFALLCFVALQHYRRSSSGSLPRGLSAAFILLAFLLAPQSEFILNGLRFAGQIKAIALAALFFIGLCFPFPLSSANGGYVRGKLEGA
jgi:hypothetical protein